MESPSSRISRAPLQVVSSERDTDWMTGCVEVAQKHVEVALNSLDMVYRYYIFIVQTQVHPFKKLVGGLNPSEKHESQLG